MESKISKTSLFPNSLAESKGWNPFPRQSSFLESSTSKVAQIKILNLLNTSLLLQLTLNYHHRFLFRRITLSLLISKQTSPCRSYLSRNHSNGKNLWYQKLWLKICNQDWLYKVLKKPISLTPIAYFLAKLFRQGQHLRSMSFKRLPSWKVLRWTNHSLLKLIRLLKLIMMFKKLVKINLNCPQISSKKLEIFKEGTTAKFLSLYFQKF